MKCQYCNADLSDGVLFCNNCGQSLQQANTTKSEMESFWQAENSQKQKDVISQLSSLKQKAEQLQEPIQKGRRFKSKKLFFRMLFLLFFVCILILAYSAYKASGEPIVPYINLGITSMITIGFILIVAAYATMIMKKGFVGIFYPLIPIYGYYYLLYSICIGFKNLFAPLEKSESAYVKDLKVKILELGLLKKEEKDLKTGLTLIDKNILKTDSLQGLKTTIVVENKKINAWQVAVLPVVVAVVVAFAIVYHYSPLLISNIQFQ